MPRAEVEARRIRAETGASVEHVAARLGAEVVFGPMPRDLYRDGERTVIGVNSVHAPARQRFTITHEVGHLVLHAGRPVVPRHLQSRARTGARRRPRPILRSGAGDRLRRQR